MAGREREMTSLPESYLRAREKSTAQRRIDEYVAGNITQEEYGKQLRAEVARREAALLRTEKSSTKSTSKTPVFLNRRKHHISRSLMRRLLAVNRSHSSKMVVRVGGETEHDEEQISSDTASKANSRR